MNEKKSNNGLIIALVVCLAILLTVILGIIVIPKIGAFNKDIFDKITSSKEKDKTEIELSYTETSDVKIDGVYVTDVSEVVEKVMPSIVSITSKTLVNVMPSIFNFNSNSTQRYAEGAGSGIIISKTDDKIMILTNNHVVADADALAVSFINEGTFDAEVVGVSEKKDIAVISVKIDDIDTDTLSKIKVATMGDSDQLKVGNGVIAIGNALGYGQSVTTGVVSALDRAITIDNYSNKMIQIDAAINGGNSGGALLNSRGEVVGINSAKYSSSIYTSSASIEGMGFAIPISNVKDTITALMNGEKDPSDVALGVEGYIITEQYNKVYNIPIGFYISRIEPDSSVDKAGIEIGNIISKIDGKDVKAFSDIQSVLSDKKKGDKVTLMIKYISGKEYKEKKVEVTL